MKSNWHKLPLPAYQHYGSGQVTDTDPWADDVTEQEIEQWRARDLDERWATTDVIARCLTWLERECGTRARMRTGGPDDL